MESKLYIKAEEIVSSIKRKQPLLETEAERLLLLDISKSKNKLDEHFWCVSATGEALKKLNIITLQNFNYIETMGLISVVRYIFEMSIWLKLFRLNSSYGHVYYQELLKTQTTYWTRSKQQLENEIAFLNSIGGEESNLIEKELVKLGTVKGKEREKLQQNFSSRISTEIDALAARSFSLYSEQAAINGYGYQASMIGKKPLQECSVALEQLEKEKIDFDSKLLNNISSISTKRWNWKEKAILVGMEAEYDYIYMLTSILLHATPASISTDAQNITEQELVVFLRYIDVKLRDILEISSSL